MQEQLDNSTTAINKAKAQIKTTTNLIEKLKISIEECDKKVADFQKQYEDIRTSKISLEGEAKQTGMLMFVWLFQKLLNKQKP